MLHSAGEDIDILSHLMQSNFGSLFDTQIASSFLGFGKSIGYQSLVSDCFNVHLSKEHTRSNWLARPLTDEQLDYAAADVRYLLPLYRELSQRLSASDRAAWAAEDCDKARVNGLPNPDSIHSFYTRMHSAWKYPINDQWLLQQLCIWRESIAIGQNIPKTFIAKNASLQAIIENTPLSISELINQCTMHPSGARKYGKELINHLLSLKDNPPETYPEKLPRPPTSQQEKALFKQLRSDLAVKAEKLSLPPELIVNRKKLEQITCEHIHGKTSTIKQLGGWREQLLTQLINHQIDHG